MTSEPAVLGSVLVVVVAAGVALVAVLSGRRRHLPTLAVVATVVLVVVATGLPTHWSSGSGGADLRLAPGHGGLGKAGLQLLRGSPGAAAQLFVLNGLVYVPLGAALAWRWPSRGRALVVPLVVSIAVECTQYLMLDRVAATDDVVLNVGGAVVGWLLMGWSQRSRTDPTDPATSTPQHADVGPGLGS